jgi:hypothetical protein
MTQVVFMTADFSGVAPAGQLPFDEPPHGVAERASRWHERSPVRDGWTSTHGGGAGRRGSFVNRTRPLVK